MVNTLMLYDRIIGNGTINEPEGKPEPEYALRSTVNWMRALAMLVEEHEFSFRTARKNYEEIGKRHMDELVENTVLEQLFLGLHHLSAIEALAEAKNPADMARLGILGWYYGLTNAASAMIAAQDGSFQEDHSGTARIWDTVIANEGRAMPPFEYRVSSLVEKEFKPEVNVIRAESKAKLIHEPEDLEDALGCIASYLSGSAKWYAWKTTEDIRKTKEFKALGVDDFRTKAARELRDNRFSQKPIGFLHQAFRYRGKANYREALFLAYDVDPLVDLKGFISDQADVLRAFLTMAGAFSSRKLGKKTWNEFVEDVEISREFSTSVKNVWKA